MKTLEINCSKNYKILIGENLSKQAGSLLSSCCPKSRLCIVTDETVRDLYGGRDGGVRQSLEEAGYEVFEYAFPAGEENKTLQTAGAILNFLADNHFDRGDILLALGGGVPGDMTGFTAAIYMRGIRFIQMPTTLLACVDSSIGGKTGVDLPAGKNLAGAFWHPEIVISDTKFFDTLSQDLYRDGLAEIIKAGMIADASILDDLAADDFNVFDRDALTDSIVKALTVKSDLVEADERENGIRQLLNFGHTIGHAIETCSDFEISHGHAVATGSLLAAAGAEGLGWTAPGCADILKALLARFHYDPKPGFSARDLANAALSDKKRRGETITIVYPKQPGKGELRKLPVSQLEHFIQCGLDKL